MQFLHKVFNDDIKSKIKVYGCQPELHTNITNDKNYHMKKVCELHDEPLDRAILFDDVERNIKNAEGFCAYKVNSFATFCFADYTV